MKKIQYIIMTLACVLLASCMADDYAAPETDEAPFGNNYIEETNVITIAQLKAKYATVIANDDMKQITDDIQIKGVVVGNDIEGNIYNEVSIDDGTGAFIICIAQGGLFGYLPVGQEILVDLRGLYIGAYGGQGEIGTPYTSASGSTYVSRMSRSIWNAHFKLLGEPHPENVVPIECDIEKIRKKDTKYMEENCGRLMVLRNVRLTAATGTAVYAPSDGSVQLTSNCANRAFDEVPSGNLVLRTSTYADFANNVMPTGKIDVTGVFTRYRNTWQILLRTLSDVQPATE